MRLEILTSKSLGSQRVVGLEGFLEGQPAFPGSKIAWSSQVDEA